MVQNPEGHCQETFVQKTSIQSFKASQILETLDSRVLKDSCRSAIVGEFIKLSLTVKLSLKQTDRLGLADCESQQRTMTAKYLKDQQSILQSIWLVIAAWNLIESLDLVRYLPSWLYWPLIGDQRLTPHSRLFIKLLSLIVDFVCSIELMEFISLR